MMNLIRGKFFLLFLLSLQLTSYGQFKDINLYVGVQSLNNLHFNNSEALSPDWAIYNAKAAFSSELSINYFPTKSKRFFVQTGFKYFRLNGQHKTVEYISEFNGIDLGELPELFVEYGDYEYGFDFQYATYFISPTYTWPISNSMNVTFGVGGMIYLASTKQEGVSVFTAPDSFAITNSQYEGNYQDYGLAYNLSTTISKVFTDKFSLSLKAEYSFMEITIGEDSKSVLYYGNSDFAGQSGITVPIHKQTLDLSGLNLMIGFSFRLAKN
ncbi:MAG: hypothetical protein ABJH98_11600 [Reichenbachiella sp.]|uniref:hypothetical protein n=1 Tax=Reichenbachiella sp. TaxID=2184521 RepID=UPI0032986DB8